MDEQYMVVHIPSISTLKLFNICMTLCCCCCFRVGFGFWKKMYFFSLQIIMMINKEDHKFSVNAHKNLSFYLQTLS